MECREFSHVPKYILTQLLLMKNYSTYLLTIASVLIMGDVYCQDAAQLNTPSLPTDLKEDVSLRDLNTKHFILPDGKMEAYISGGPIHYLSEGNFLDIDASIIPASGAFAMKNEANLIKSYYPNDLSTAGVKVVGNDWSMTLGSASKLVAISSNGTELSILEEAGSSEITSSATKAIYPNLFTNASAEYEVNNGYIKNNIVLNSMPSNLPSGTDYLAYSEVITIPEGFTLVSAEMEMSGEHFISSGLNLLDVQGNAVAAIPVPEVYELNNSAKTIFADGVWDKTYKVSKLSATTFELSTLVPMSWLTQSGRQFPVVVDPTVTLTGQFGGWQNSANGYNDATFFVFTANSYSGTTYRAWTKWNISSIPNNALIFDSEVQMYCNGGVTGADTINVNDVTGTYGNYGAYNSSAYADLANGNYIQFPTNGVGQNYGYYDLGTTCDQDIEDELGNTWFQLAFTMAAGTTNWKRFTATSSYLRVTYLICSGQITGTISSSALNSAGNHIDCYGDSTASISTTAANGGSTYTYQWSGPNGYAGTTSSVSNAGAGVYAVTISSGTVCPATLDTTILGPGMVLINDTVSNYSGYGTSCFDSDDGEITLTPTGGASFTYSWTGPSSFTATTQNLTGLEAGWYFVTLTESSFSCEASDSVYVSPAPYLYLTVDSISNAYCEFDENGGAKATGFGGILPLTIDWDNSETGTYAYALNAGPHSVSITDAHGCEFDEGFNVAFDNAAPNVSLGGTDTGYCDGGSIILNAGGGYESYDWGGGVVGQLLQVSALGTYSITVTSFAGCEGSTSINVSEVYDLPEPDLGPNVNAPTSPVILDPGIYVAYVWNTGSLDSVISVSIAGTYSVTVTDNHSCQGTDEVKVKFWTTGVDELNNGSFSLFPNPSSTEVRIIGDQSALAYIIRNAQGQLVRSSNLGQSAVNETIDVSDFANGIYFIELQDEAVIWRSSFIKN